MSKLIVPRPRIALGSSASKKHFAIVASQFNVAYVQGLIDHVTAELRILAPGITTSLIQVPGSFEIPVVVRELALRKRGDVIIAIGVILQGETNHAENLSRSVTDALQRIAVTHGLPVVNAVLTFDDEEQARARCLDNEINRGTEAARAAVEISNVIAKLRNK
jgi:6,7-dimethyl-8-ribityllumazine synthase